MVWANLLPFILEILIFKNISLSDCRSYRMLRDSSWQWGGPHPTNVRRVDPRPLRRWEWKYWCIETLNQIFWDSDCQRWFWCYSKTYCQYLWTQRLCGIFKSVSIDPFSVFVFYSDISLKNRKGKDQLYVCHCKKNKKNFTLSIELKP